MDGRAICARGPALVHQAPAWLQGQWDKVTFDPGSLTVSLLPLADSFSSDGLQLQRWRSRVSQVNPLGTAWSELRNIGLEVRQKGKLQVAYPRGMSASALTHRAPVDNMYGQDTPELVAPYGGFGVVEYCPPTQPFQYELEHVQKLQGDFDVSLDYQDVEAIAAGNTLLFGLVVTPTVLGDPESHSVIWNREYGVDSLRGLKRWGIVGTATPPAAGQLRLARTGTAFTTYYRAQGASSWTLLSSTWGTAADLNLQIVFYYYSSAGSMTVSNFQISGNQIAPTGTFISPVYDAGRVVSWDHIQWTESLPSGCNVELEVALANNYEDFANTASPPVWFGPSGGASLPRQVVSLCRLARRDDMRWCAPR